MSGDIQLPTTGTFSGLTEQGYINTALADLATEHQGATAPTTTSTGLSSTAGLPWHDTGSNELKIRDQADSTFIVRGLIDETNKLHFPVQQGAVLPSWLRGFIDGFETGAPGGASTLTIGPGGCADATNAYFMGASSAWTKTTASWLAGTGNGALDTGSIAASTAYWVWAIWNLSTGAVDYLFSLSSSAPTMPSGFTVKRLIAWFKTDSSSHIWQFQQRGDTFIYGTTVADVNGSTAPTSATLVSLTVPSGFQVDVTFRALFDVASGTQAISFQSPDESSQTPVGTPTLQDLFATSTEQAGDFVRRTNTSGQIRVWATGTATYYVGTYGFIWTRGRNS